MTIPEATEGATPIATQRPCQRWPAAGQTWRLAAPLLLRDSEQQGQSIGRVAAGGRVSAEQNKDKGVCGPVPSLTHHNHNHSSGSKNSGNNSGNMTRARTLHTGLASLDSVRAGARGAMGSRVEAAAFLGKIMAGLVASTADQMALGQVIGQEAVKKFPGR